jgi:sugar phosphate isomerase/epimerase
MFKLSISNIAWPESLDQVIFEHMYNNNFLGLEIAPTRIIPIDPYSYIDEAKKFALNLYNTYNISISSMQSIWYGRTENIFGPDSEINILIEYTKKAINFAESIKCYNIVFGCPKNRNITKGKQPPDSIYFFNEIANYAESKNIIISLEANLAIYGTNFLNTTIETIEFIHLLAHPAIKLNFDLGTLIYEHESLDIITDNINIINHIHISEPHLLPIQTRVLHNELANILRKNQYNQYISIEMKNQDNINLVKDSIIYIKEIFS